MAADKSGNVYASDYAGNTIRKISKTGVVTTLAGSGTAGSANGTGTAASFHNPAGLATDASGNIYVADFTNNLIRKITTAGVVTTLAGSGTAGSANGTGAAASFNNPSGVAVDASGNIFVTDGGNNLIRKITPGGMVTTFAGNGTAAIVNGTGTAASFNTSHGLTIDGAGNIFVADGGQVIRKITPAGVVTTYAGAGVIGFRDDQGTLAKFHSVYAVVADALGNLYVSDEGNDFIRRIDPQRNVRTIAGFGSAGLTNDIGLRAKFRSPYGLAIDTAGNLFIADYGNNVIRKMTTKGYSFTTMPVGLTFDINTGIISGTPAANVISGTITIEAYNKYGYSTTDLVINFSTSVAAPNITYLSPVNIATGTNISLGPSNTGGAVGASIYANVTTFAGSGAAGAVNSNGAAAAFSNPAAIVTDVQGNVYLADYKNNMIRKITPDGTVSTLAGSGASGAANGSAGVATFKNPSGVAIDVAGNIYVADAGNNKIRMVTPYGDVTTIAGSGVAGSANGTGTAATFNNPRGIAIDVTGNLYVSEYSGNVIRKITRAGVVTTLAGSATAGSANGTGAAASFTNPYGLAVDAAGNIYVADAGNNLIRKITPAGAVTTYAGSGIAGAADGIQLTATFHTPYGLSFDSGGNLYVADDVNNMIRIISPAGVVTTLAGNGSPGTVNAVGTAATFSAPHSVATDLNNNIYVADYFTNIIRKISIGGYTINGALPAGLTFDGTTGKITGKTLAPNRNTTYVITGYNGAGSSQATVNISVNLPPPVIAYTSPNTFNVGKSVSLLPASTGGTVPAAIYSQVTTFAGSGTAGAVNGTGAGASFNTPFGMATDTAGNVYESDYTGNLIRKITPAGVVSTLAGSGTAGNTNGTGTSASFSNPAGLSTDVAGNVYVADLGNNLIRKITPTGLVTTFAGSGAAAFANGTGTTASFHSPSGLVLDGSGNIFVTDGGNNRIRKITPAGVVTTFAGNATAGYTNGTGTAAIFNSPHGLTIDAAQNLYIADGGNHIRKITPGAVVTNFAGSGTAGNTDGTGEAASFRTPFAMAVDLAGNIYVVDEANNLIRKITPAGVVTTLAGSTTGAADGTGTTAQFHNPHGIAIDLAGNLYVADYANNSIRKITPTGYTISPALPAGLTFNGKTGAITGIPAVASPTTSYMITAYNSGGASSITISVAVNLPVPVITYSSPASLVINKNALLLPTNTGSPVPATIYSQVTTLAGSGTAGSTNGTGPAASFNAPFGMATDTAGTIYESDYTGNLIRRITPSGDVSIFAGSGTAGAANGTSAAASFNNPAGLATDLASNLYVADLTNNLIRKISPAGVVSTLAGSGTATFANGTGTSASFNKPSGVATDRAGNLFVTDGGNNRIRKITSDGVVTTFAGSGTAGNADGTGTAAKFNTPHGLVVDATGNVFVADGGNVIRKITSAGVVTTFAGSGSAGTADGTGTAASFRTPYAMAIDLAGNIYLADEANNLIRKITPAAVVTTLAGGNTGATDGIGTAAKFHNPHGIAIDLTGNLYVADYANNLVRKITPTGYTVSPALPAGLTLNSATGVINGKPTTLSSAQTYVVTAYNSAGSSAAAIDITISTGLQVPAISYPGTHVYTAGSSMSALPVNSGGAVPVTLYSQVSIFAGSGASDDSNGTGAGANFDAPYGVTTDLAGNIFVSTYYGERIRKLTQGAVVSTLAGAGVNGFVNGTGAASKFNYPSDLTTDNSGNVYVADISNNAIRKITPDGLVTTLAGSGSAGSVNGTGTAATFHSPNGLAVSASGNIYVSDAGNNLIRMISPAGVVTTFAGSGTAGSANGTGTAANFTSPHGMAMDAAGNIYVAEGGHRIRKITPDGVVTTLAGSGSAGSADGTGTAATFNNPHDLCIDQAGNLYVADQLSNKIRKITPAGVVTTFAGTGVNSVGTGIGTAANISNPTGLDIDPLGNLYVSELSSYVVGKIVTTGYTISPALPPGLTFDGTKGTISGTPTATSPATNYLVTAYNATGSDTANISITINAPPGMAAVQTDILADSLAGDPKVAQAISPNADGRNDVLLIANIEKYPDNEFTIINAAGSLVYKAAGYDNATKVFDGHASNSKTLQKPGTYFYRLLYSDKGKMKYKTGYVLIKY